MSTPPHEAMPPAEDQPAVPEYTVNDWVRSISAEIGEAAETSSIEVCSAEWMDESETIRYRFVEYRPSNYHPQGNFYGLRVTSVFTSAGVEALYYYRPSTDEIDPRYLNGTERKDRTSDEYRQELLRALAFSKVKPKLQTTGSQSGAANGQHNVRDERKRIAEDEATFWDIIVTSAFQDNKPAKEYLTQLRQSTLHPGKLWYLSLLTEALHIYDDGIHQKHVEGWLARST